MQNVDLICVGKISAPWFAQGIAEYQKRLTAFCNFRIIELPECQIDERHSSPVQIQKALQKEGKAILTALRKGEYVVALCVEGCQLSSEDLAALIEQRAESGGGDIAFVIGSSHGLCEEVKRAAGTRFSMGRITMPHQLARLVLCEQIYRAFTINRGMKYHK
jgi:23S rRNA (pseudouridine1915-N3)-methyltransferase